LPLYGPGNNLTGITSNSIDAATDAAYRNGDGSASSPSGTLVITNTGSAGQVAIWDGGSPSGVQSGYWGTAGSGDFKADGSVPMSGVLNFGGQQATNLATPTTASSAATKEYVDAATGTVSWILPVVTVDTQRFDIAIKDGARRTTMYVCVTNPTATDVNILVGVNGDTNMVTSYLTSVMSDATSYSFSFPYLTTVYHNLTSMASVEFENPKLPGVTYTSMGFRRNWLVGKMSFIRGAGAHLVPDATFTNIVLWTQDLTKIIGVGTVIYVKQEF